MEVNVTNYHPYTLVNQLGKQLNLEPTQDCLERFISFPSEIGKAKILGFEFSDGIDLLIITGQFHEDFHLHYLAKDTVPLIFKFCIEGGVFHRISSGFITYQLNIMQGSITANKRRKKESFRIPSKRDITFVMIFLNRTEYMEKIDCYSEDMPIKLQEVFNDIAAEKTFFYEGNYSVGVSDCVQDIKKDASLDIVRATFVEGKTLELLSKLIKQYRDDLRPTGKQVLLRKYDLDKILLAKEILVSNIQAPPTIEELSRIVGINQTKLKKGFKQVFDHTIKAFLIKQRIDLAKLLLVRKEDNIQEIAYSVGYSNVSHFSRLFKRKVGILPKDFSKQVMTKLHPVQQN